MPLSDEEVRFGYLYVLGREPESADVFNQFRHMTFDQFRNSLFVSDEGRRKVREISVYGGDPPYLSSDQDTVCFIHLEKTGGTTLHDVIARHYLETQVSSPHFSQLHLISMAEICRYKFISGHFDYYTTLFIPRVRLKRVSIFRNPIDRLLSFYRFQRSHPRTPEWSEDADPYVELAHQLAPVEFFRHPTIFHSPRVNNAYLRTFGTTIYKSVATNETDGERMAIFKLASQRIADLEALGLTERMDESAALICRALGHAPPVASIKMTHRTDDMPRTNAQFATVSNVELTAELRSSLRPLVTYDLELYRLADTEFRKRQMRAAAASQAL
jgi:hypothetical protein